MRPFLTYRRAVAATLLLIGLSPQRPVLAQSFTLVYDFTGQAGNQASQAPTPASVPVGLTPGNLVRGAGISAASGANGMAASGFTTGAGIDPADYFSLSVAPATGKTLTLTQLVFSERRSATGIHSFVLRSSLDGFVSNLFTASVPDNTQVRRQTVTLSGSFQNLLGPTELRLYGFQSESGTGTWRLGINATSADNPSGFPADMRLTGSLANASSSSAPEPGSMVFLSLGILGVGALRRRVKMPVTNTGRAALTR